MSNIILVYIIFLIRLQLIGSHPGHQGGGGSRRWLRRVKVHSPTTRGGKKGGFMFSLDFHYSVLPYSARGVTGDKTYTG